MTLHEYMESLRQKTVAVLGIGVSNTPLVQLLLRSGIRVNSVSPGTTDTPSLAERLQAFDDPEDARRRFIGRQPMGRLGTAEEVAAAIVFLAARDAAFITGADLAVDGGMTC